VELKKGYKETEVGVIPEEWEVVNAGAIGRFRGGNGFSLKFQGRTNGTYPFFKVSDMNNEGNETFMFQANHRITEETRKQLGATAFPAGSIVFAKVGAAIFLERKKILAQPSCIDNNLTAFVLDGHRADVRFVHTLLLATKLGSLVATTALPSISGKQLNELVLRLPPLPEQRTIAAALSDVDALIGGLEQLIAKKRDLKQAAMQQLLTGQTRLPGFHGEWEVKRLATVCAMKSGEGITNANIDGFSKYPCYGGNGLRGFTSRFTHNGGYALIGRQGALCGNVLGVDGTFFASEHAIVVTAISEIDIRWLTYVLGEMHLNQYSESSAQPGLSVAKLLDLDLTVPPTKEEQTAIVEVLSDMDAELAIMEQRRDKTSALKQGMMQELLTGKTRLI
jgi:type I restriction enzyme S subunit